MSRIKRVGKWCAVLSTFAVFSVLLLGGLAGVGSAATVSDAVSRLAASGDLVGADGSFVVVPANQSLVGQVLGNKTVEVCWITNAQLTTIQSKWQTIVSRIGPFSVATVDAPGVSENEMRPYVSGGRKCVLVHTRSLFFLPIEGGVS